MIGCTCPKITCVTVTVGRVELIKQSIRCYTNQSYPNLNMVILTQGSAGQNAAILAHVQALGRPDIRVFDAPPTLSLGAMRNTSVELANGDVICQWDDDDLCHPERVAAQYRNLRSDSRRTATAYGSFLKLFDQSRELYWCDWSGEPLPTHRLLCGTVMFYKEAFHAFPIFYPSSGHQSDCEEDLNVLEKLMTKGEVGSLLDPHYVYCYHGSNTYDLDHHRLTLDTQWGKKVMPTPELLKRRALLEETLSLVGLDGPVSVRSLDGEAFIYGRNP